MIYSKYTMFYKILDLKILHYKTENIIIIFFILKIEIYNNFEKKKKIMKMRSIKIPYFVCD